MAPLRSRDVRQSPRQIKWRASVARCPPKPRLTPARRLGLDLQAVALTTQRDEPPHSCHWQLYGWPDNGGTMPSESTTFTPSSILFRPRHVSVRPVIRSFKTLRPFPN